jgi:hypothetical protein
MAPPAENRLMMAEDDRPRGYGATRRGTTTRDLWSGAMKRLELPREDGPWSFRRFEDRAAAWAFFEGLEPGAPPPLCLDEPWLAPDDTVLPAGTWIVIYRPIIF